MELRRALATQVATRRAEVRDRESRLHYPAAARAIVAAERRRVTLLSDRLQAAMRAAAAARRLHLSGAAQRLDAVSPLRVLDRGYALVSRADDHTVVTDAHQVAVGDELAIRVARGRIRARTTAREM